MAVGVPTGEGKVILLGAQGPTDASGYGQHSSWRLQAEIYAEPGQIGALFGHALSLSTEYCECGSFLHTVCVPVPSFALSVHLLLCTEFCERHCIFQLVFVYVHVLIVVL